MTEICNLWHWMSWIQRLDIIALALMLMHIAVIVIHVSWWYESGRRTEGIEDASRAVQRDRRKLVADLNIKVRALNLIALVAPYLGLAGASIGLITGLRGVGMEAESALVAVTVAHVVQLAFVTTLAGLLVAIPAAGSYNYLRTRLDLLESEMSTDAPAKWKRYSVGGKKFRSPAQFSIISFPLTAAPSLAILVGYVAMLYSSYHTATGLEVTVSPVTLRCEHDGERFIVLHVTDAGQLFLNYERVDRNRLADRLSEIYGLRLHRTLYVFADDDAPFQQVADAIDIVTNTPVVETSTSQKITVRLVTPKAVHAHCLVN